MKEPDPKLVVTPGNRESWLSRAAVLMLYPLVDLLSLLGVRSKHNSSEHRTDFLCNAFNFRIKTWCDSLPYSLTLFRILDKYFNKAGKDNDLDISITSVHDVNR